MGVFPSANDSMQVRSGGDWTPFRPEKIAYVDVVAKKRKYSEVR